MICLALGYVACYIGIHMLHMDVVSFMVREPVAFIFGTIVVLNTLQGSLSGRLKQPVNDYELWLASVLLDVTFPLRRTLNQIARNRPRWV